MTKSLRYVLGAALLLTQFAAHGTGLATCESEEKLQTMLKEKGWTVRRIKEDGGCYEVYATDDKGERVEAYFHPLTLAPVPTKKPWWKP
jgi:hypothetical protein